jgi:hypothetical protein
MIGKRFSRLVVIAPAPTSPTYRGRQFHCRCDCGASTVVAAASLRRKTTRSCGCLRREHAGKHESAFKPIHGLAKTVEYRAWSNMKDRCHNSRNPKYRDYGGRDITVCNEWRGSFTAFLVHIGPRPSPKHSIDRNISGHTPRGPWQKEAPGRFPVVWLFGSPQSVDRSVSCFV